MKVNVKGIMGASEPKICLSGCNPTTILSWYLDFRKHVGRHGACLCVMVKYYLPYLVLNLGEVDCFEPVTVLPHWPRWQRKNWANTHFLSGGEGGVHYWFYRYILSASVRILNIPWDDMRVRGQKAAVRRRKYIFLSTAQHSEHSSSNIPHFTAAESGNAYTFSPQRNKDVWQCIFSASWFKHPVMCTYTTLYYAQKNIYEYCLPTKTNQMW